MYLPLSFIFTMEEVKLFLGQFVIWVILLLGQLNGYKSCTEKERGALLELKRYIVSQVSKPTVRNDVLPTWTTWTNDTKSDCCRWKGIACNRTSRRVIELSFNSSLLNPLGDSYPLNLSLLHPFEELRTMNLSWGRHSDDLPRSQFHGFFDDVEGYQSLWRLRKLEILDLSSNEFNNSIYPFLNAATSLTTLFLGSNDMDGPIPMKELKNLTNLEVLDLSGNRFDGSMRELTHLKKLRVLDLSHNYFSGSMEELKVSASLEQLNLGRNRINGSMSDHLKEFRALCLSLVAHNRFSGHFLPERTSFPLMNELRIDNNSFSGEIGVGLLSSTMLQILDMSNNCLTGTIPRWIIELSSLDHLLLSNNFLQGTVPPRLLDIEYLDLSGNQFSGALPSRVNNAGDTRKTLFLHNNNFTGAIPSTLVENVQILDLRNNKLSGSIPQFVDLEAIIILLLKGNDLSGSIPKELCALSNVRILDLSDNKLSGFIPSCLYKLSSRREDLEHSGIFSTSGGSYAFGWEIYRSTFVVEQISMSYTISQEFEIKFTMKQRYESYIGGSFFSDGALDYMEHQYYGCFL